MIAVIKFLGMFGIILGFIVHHEIVKLFIWGEQKRLNYFLKSISFTCKAALRLLAIDVQFPKGHSVIKGQLIVCNHVSYTDALILFAYYPSLFVTSQEIRETFLLGRVTYLAGCFFVERRKSHRSQGTVARELESMKRQLTTGHNICMFPEGTSSNGETVLPFKSVFFQTVIDCKISAKPLCLKYTEISSQKFSKENADYVCWYGDMTFADHLFKLCQQKSVKAEIHELPALSWELSSERATLAQMAHEKIKECYHS
jgi:1-acyl-sn-glycerol-3-phosphate acyltransferase